MVHHSNKLFTLAATLTLIILLNGCDKNDVPAPQETPDRNRIGYILEDNFNYSYCQALLNYTGQTAVLRKADPATFLAPDNAAFLRLQLNFFPNNLYSNNWYYNIAQYATIPGSHAFRKMPLGDNQPLSSFNGNRMYVSRYLLNGDTITRVNGVKVATADIKASNGLLQAVEEIVQPETVKNLEQFFLSDTSFTLFSLALQHSGLMPMLRTGEYTLLAPGNSVMRTQGNILPGVNLSTPEDILAIDPTTLAGIIKYHILPGRSFLDRIQRSAAASGDNSIQTLNGEKILVGGNSETYNTTTFKGRNNAGNAGIFRSGNSRQNFADIPAGNGVVHGINQVLIP